jgi:hypothetical protein
MDTLQKIRYFDIPFESKVLQNNVNNCRDVLSTDDSAWMVDAVPFASSNGSRHSKNVARRAAKFCQRNSCSCYNDNTYTSTTPELLLCG